MLQGQISARGIATRVQLLGPFYTQAAADEVSGMADECVENIKIVKLFGAEGRELGRFQGLVDKAHGLAKHVVWLQGEPWTSVREAGM
mgnify:CR=1 FL=1